MMKPIGAVLGAGPARCAYAGRARDPVRRGSRPVGTCEGGWWRATSRREVQRVLLAAKRYELLGRPAGCRRGPLGHVGLEVLELLANLVSHRSGRLEPSYAYLMAKLRRSKDAVHQALMSLRAHGFLDWLRRHEKVELVEGPGPRVRQVSNAYRLSLPARAAQLLGPLLGREGATEASLPDDVLQERADRAEWLAAHKAGLPLAELPLTEVEDDRLARVLGELGRAVEARARTLQERESARRSESTARY